MRVCTLIALACLATTLPIQAQQTIGLFLDSDAAYEGYTLFAPLSNQVTYLIDNQGRLINSWTSNYRPGVAAYLLESGSILRTADLESPFFLAGGRGGRIEEIGWDGLIVWEYEYADPQFLQHHDVELLPGGNLLLIAWELKSVLEAIAAGRHPGNLPQNEVWPDHIIEVEPVGASSGNIVWEWHVWDHLVQDLDPTKDNFGVVADHPELIDVNFGTAVADWLHINAVDYNAELDQIILSAPRFNEIWIIDHSTTSEQAAGHTGGNSGRGGDLLYRWGNPQAYDRGAEADRKLFGQHNAQWIAPDLPGAGNILLFNNGVGRTPSSYSSVDEFTPPVDQDGNYTSPAPGLAFEPVSLSWTYFADPLTDFYSSILSGAERQPNGNTLICAGTSRFFEVTTLGATVWEYRNPVNALGPLMQGSFGGTVFRSPRYPPDYAAFDGRELTPGDLVEVYDAPPPVPDGTVGTTPVTIEKLVPTGTRLEFFWDGSSCAAHDYNMLYGHLEDVSTLALQGSRCALGNAGTHIWVQMPPEDLFFLLVGVDETDVYESSWGLDSAGEERRGTIASYECSATNKVVAGSICP